MSDTLVVENNGVELDSEIVRLKKELGYHVTQSALPEQGLVLAYNFPPFSDASAATVAKRIRQFGRKVDVVSQDMSAIRRTDPDLSELVSGFVDRHFQLSGRPGFAAWSAIRRYVLDGYSAIQSSLRSKKYGFIYSRSMFPATHFLAGFIKSRHPEVLWISEFSDPVRHDVEGNYRTSPKVPNDYVAREIENSFSEPIRKLLKEDRTVYAWCEAFGLGAADKVVFTNQHQKDMMIGPYLSHLPPEELARKAIVSPHPTLGAEYYRRAKTINSTKRNNYIDIGYFGEFYPNRGVGELVRAISGLESEVRDRFRLNVFTSNVENAKKSLEALPIDTSFVKVKPAKNLFTFLRLASEMEALYLADVAIGLGYSQNPYLPSKFSDYKGANVPIIASVWPGSIMSKMDGINKFLLGDVFALRDFLSRLDVSTRELSGRNRSLITPEQPSDYQ